MLNSNRNRWPPVAQRNKVTLGINRALDSETRRQKARGDLSPSKVEQPLSFHCRPHLISVLGSLGTSSMLRESVCVLCVCVLWLISVRGKWKPLISHLSLLRKSCHSLWTRCHLHSFNQDLSHCLTCSCARILIWGLHAHLRFSF